MWSGFGVAAVGGERRAPVIKVVGLCGVERRGTLVGLGGGGELVVRVENHTEPGDRRGITGLGSGSGECRVYHLAHRCLGSGQVDRGEFGQRALLPAGGQKDQREHGQP